MMATSKVFSRNSSLWDVKLLVVLTMTRVSANNRPASPIPDKSFTRSSSK